MNPEILAVAVLIAAACALPGVFLVLRRMTLMADAISHAVLPGLVAGYLLGQTLDGPLPWLGAVGASLFMVWAAEALVKTRLVAGDAAIGLVFPALFSLGVLLVAQYADQVHLDVDAVLLGELVFVPLDRIELFGQSWPRSLVTAGILAAVNLTWALALFKELKLATFDPGLAHSLGFKPVLLHYALMTAVSLTAIGSFDAVGSVLVVAFIVAPAAAAYLLFESLGALLLAAPLFGAAAATAGYALALSIDGNLAGAMAFCAGLIFTASFLFAPKRGLIAAWARRRRQAWDFALGLLTVHLSQHQNHPDAPVECSPRHLTEHISWTEAFARQVMQKAELMGLVKREAAGLRLTETGRRRAAEAVEA